MTAGRIGLATRCLIFKQALECGLAWSLSVVSLICLFAVQENGRRRGFYRANRMPLGPHKATAGSPPRVSICRDCVRQAPRLAGRGLVKAYRYSFAALAGFQCRHLPTCSDYADEALDRHGLWAGGWITLARLCRCHPWGTSGLDFVPAARPPRARWFTPWRYGRWSAPNTEPSK